jgi:hypothetical protein
MEGPGLVELLLFFLMDDSSHHFLGEYYGIGTAMMEGKVGYAFVYCRASVSINAMFLL